MTNRDLQKAFGFTLGQIKTWAVLVLGRDPDADQGGGVRRQYSLDEGFKIFLCGLLVSRYRMGLKDAQRHVNFIWPWLVKKEMLPSAVMSGALPIPNEITIFPDLYRLRIFSEITGREIGNDPIDSEGHDRVERFREWCFYRKGKNALKTPGPSYIISIFRCVGEFLKDVPV